MPIKPRHRYEVDLVDFVIRVLKERVHLESLDERPVDAENINDGLLLVGGKDVTRIVQYRAYFQIRRTQRPLPTLSALRIHRV